MMAIVQVKLAKNARCRHTGHHSLSIPLFLALGVRVHPQDTIQWVRAPLQQTSQVQSLAAQIIIDMINNVWAHQLPTEELVDGK